MYLEKRKPNTMKTLLKLFMALFVFTPMLGNAQGSTLTSVYVDSSQFQVCDTSYYFSISAQTMDLNSTSYGNIVFNGSNYINASLTATVDWGDNTITNHTGTVVSNGVAIVWNTPISHYYGSGGNYIVLITLTDPVSGSAVTVTTTISTGVCSNTVVTAGALDCDNDGVYEGTINNIPLIAQNGNNVYTGNTIVGNNQFYNVLPGNYQIIVDPAWLAANGYIVQSITPDSLTLDIFNSFQTVAINLTCDSTLFVPQCLNGITFCDADNNGILDSLETVLPNAPVTLVLDDGTLMNTTSDANGAYSFNYTGMSLGGMVYVDQQWVATNGYFPSFNAFDSLPNLDCTNNVVSNIPVICDSSALGTGCIDGYLFCDANNNGILDSNENVLSGATISLNGIGTTVSVTTDSTGYFSYSGWQLSSPAGLVTVMIDTAWLAANGYVSNSIYTFTGLNCNTPNTIYIGINCTNTSGCADLWTTVTPWIGYYQNTVNSIKLSWGNYGQLAPGGYTLTLDYPSGVTPVTSSINNPNYTISGNTITWNLTSNSTWFYNSDVIYFNTPAGIPDSTFHVFSSTITPDSTECDSLNNYSTLGMYVGVSYDPNDKSVNQPLYVDPGVQDEYTYVIRFQNTGTAPAQDVYIMDTLSNHLDWSTLQVIETTHQMQLIDNGNGVIRFDFPQIWLPDSTNNEPASHGHVVYKIKEKVSVGLGDVVENTAYIYFDQNAPVITNTTQNINMILSIEHPESIALSLYPNPTNGLLNVMAETPIQQIRVLDLSGKLVMEATPLNAQHMLDVTHLSEGVYAVQVMTTEGQTNRIFVKH